jgi:hypothetical protein
MQPSASALVDRLQESDDFTRLSLRGISLPPTSASKQDDYLRELRGKINSVFDSEGEFVEVPDDYKALLRICDDVRDPDLRSLPYNLAYSTPPMWPVRDKCPLSGGVLYKRGYYMPVVWVMLSQH